MRKIIIIYTYFRGQNFNLNQIKILAVSIKRNKNLKNVENISEKLKSYLKMFLNIHRVKFMR